MHLAITEWNDSGPRGVIDNLQDRIAPVKVPLGEFGCELIDWYYAPTEQRCNVLVRGEMIALKGQVMLVRSSGGFDHVSFWPLFSAKEAQDAMLKANALAGKFDGPNHDEIDRMLL